MAYLVPDKVIREGGVIINQKLTPDGYRLKPNQKMDIKSITVHNTGLISTNAATNPAEQYARATYPNGNMGAVAVHYWVFKNVIWQQLRDDEQGWHGGRIARSGKRGNIMTANANSISIEIIGADPESEETGKKLVALLCKRHKLEPNKDVYTHNFWMYGVDVAIKGVRKNCPIYILDHWTKFIDETQKIFNPQVIVKPEVKIPGIKAASGLLKIIHEGALNVRRTPQFIDNIDQTVSKGAVFTVTGITDDGVFYQLKSGLFVTTHDKYVQFIKDIEIPSFKDYLIRVKVDKLNIRKGPAVSHEIVGSVRDGQVFTIVDEKEGWGKLKSGVGWISLNYTEDVK